MNNIELKDQTSGPKIFATTRSNQSKFGKSGKHDVIVRKI